jgi:hypothetical protein
MSRPTLEVADIFRASGDSFIDRSRSHIAWLHLKVMRAIERRRTAALGGHHDYCSGCGEDLGISYNSCRNRHCPKCQGLARQRWTARRIADLVPLTYFHVVFTVPQQLSALILQNKRLLYSLLFRSSAETLTEVAANPRHLGAEIGFLGVLHTWGQTLEHHPHIHYVAPEGGFSKDHSTWIKPRCRFFLPVKVLSRVFWGKFVDAPTSLYRSDQLQLHGSLKALREPRAIPRVLAHTVSGGLGGLCQEAFRRPQTRAPLLVAVHAPGSHLESSAAQLRGWQSDLPVEGLCARQQAAQNDIDGARIHPAVYATRAATRVRAHPALRVDGESEPGPARHGVPYVAGAGQAPGPLHCRHHLLAAVHIAERRSP